MRRGKRRGRGYGRNNGMKGNTKNGVERGGGGKREEKGEVGGDMEKITG